MYFDRSRFGICRPRGNVDEIRLRCCENGYDGAPVDGSARRPENCTSRVHRGGAWNDVPAFVRSAHRCASDPKDRKLERLPCGALAGRPLTLPAESDARGRVGSDGVSLALRGMRIVCTLPGQVADGRPEA